MDQYILGLSCFYHDSAAVVLKNGKIIAAAQEERFTRIKQDANFPINAIKFCLQTANIKLEQISGIYYYEEPNTKFSRIISTYLNFGLSGIKSFPSSVSSWLTKKLHVKNTIKTSLSSLLNAGERCPEVHFIPHHESHAASAFYPSPFKEAAVLCIDGVGEWATTSAWLGRDNKLEKLWEIRFPHSLGLLYSAFTYFCGFKVDSGEYKLMGLAPYGEPKYYQTIIDNLIDIKSDGSFWLNMEYFDYAIGDTMTNDKFAQLFDGPKREPESELTNREFDLAASVQAVLEHVVYLLAKNIKQETGADHICLSGGVALNCVSNGKLEKKGLFKSVWAQPASGDSGGSLGAALCGWFSRQGNPRHSDGINDQMLGGYLGSEYSDEQIEAYLNQQGAIYSRIESSKLAPTVANILAQGNVVGWFQGRMEFGPRALGGRSILGDPRCEKMQSTMNLKIKNRESFRPFAPSVLTEQAANWFDMDSDSPYMLFVHPVRHDKRIATSAGDDNKQGIEKLKVKRSEVPAITHVDYSARIQTVSKDRNSLYHDLISEFYKKTDCPIVVNTSFNVRGEPIVESPENAYTCFMRTAMDYLVLGSFVLDKTQQPNWEESIDWKKEFALD
ncbi:MAG: carbamoyltransferase [Gammaproteobacteria bacterium]|nr:carbamoyltransferase [Gammaproteobacteria bacterium]